MARYVSRKVSSYVAVRATEAVTMSSAFTVGSPGRSDRLRLKFNSWHLAETKCRLPGAVHPARSVSHPPKRPERAEVSTTIISPLGPTGESGRCSRSAGEASEQRIDLLLARSVPSMAGRREPTVAFTAARTQISRLGLHGD